MTSSNGRDFLVGRSGSDAINGGSGDGTIKRGAGSDSLNGGASDTLVYNFSENIGASLTVPCAMDARLCRGHLAGCNAEKKPSDDSQVDLSEMAKRRIAYAAKIAECQYKQAKRICDEINGMPIGKDDPMVLAVLKAIATNYAALDQAAESRACSYPEVAEIDDQSPRFTARGSRGQVR